MIKAGKYLIDADVHCYSLHEERIATKDIKSAGVKEGETYCAPLNQYFPTLAWAIRAIVRREQRQMVADNDMSLREAIAAFRELEGKILSEAQTGEGE